MKNPFIILFFVKMPVAGEVKSRLARTISADTAARLYRCFVEDMLVIFESQAFEYRICYYPVDSEPHMRQWLGNRCEYLPQYGCDLGERMLYCFNAAFESGFSHVVAVGSDSPDMPPELILQAKKELARNDCVMGPAEDGGYYLLGFRKDGFVPTVFSGIQWGTSRVFEHTLLRLNQSGASCSILYPWWDVDTFEDLEQLICRNMSTAFSSSNTFLFLRKTGYIK